MEKNDFLEYYGKYHISPVVQDISNFNEHCLRRKKLYRQLGMPFMLFENKEMLEVGPGRGYNSLVFFEGKIKHLDLVEANLKGIEDMRILFEQYKVSNEKYDIFESKIEDFNTEKKYDVVIAESFLQNLKNQQEVIDKLRSLTKEGGIIVVTCSDNICFYIEQIKRLIAHALSYQIEDYNEKEKYLIKIFEPQLKKLRGFSRNIESWVQDQMLNPVAVNGTSLSLIEAIRMFGDDCDVLSTAPRIFTEYSWYKDIWYDDKKSYLQQYEEKGINLILANLDKELKLTQKNNEIVNRIIQKQRIYASNYEEKPQLEILLHIVNENKKLTQMLKNNDERLDAILNEITLALEFIIDNGVEKFSFSKYTNLFAAFGRTQQYISFIKNGE